MTAAMKRATNKKKKHEEKLDWIGALSDQDEDCTMEQWAAYIKAKRQDGKSDAMVGKRLGLGKV